MNGNSNTTNYVSRNIRSLRIKSGLSLKVVANALEISTSALSKIEKGATDVNLSRLEQIASFYKVSLIQLWTLDFENKEIYDEDLNIAKKKVSDLESEIAAFQRKIILLYEKLREQPTDLKVVHA